MPIKEVIEETKTRAARSQRRAAAVKEHGKTVIATGIDAAKHVAAVAAMQLKSALQTQKATLRDPSLTVLKRVRQLRPNAITSAVTARTEITTAIREGYRSVSDRLAHVTSVTHKEQAIENRISRKAKKVKKAAAVRTSALHAS